MIRHPLVGLALALVAGIAPRGAAQQYAGYPVLATFNGPLTATDPHVSPDGRFVLAGRPDGIEVQEVATHRTRKLTDGPSSRLAWSPAGDRIAWVRPGDNGDGRYVWTMPVDPRTKAAAGPPQRVSAGEAESPSFSPDGKWIAYDASDNPTGEAFYASPSRLAVVPVTGGPERIVAHFKHSVTPILWGAEGKTIYTQGQLPTATQEDLVRAYLDGRPAESIRNGAREWLVGITSSRRYLVTVPAKNPMSPGDRALVIDTTGKEVGGAPVPVGLINEYDDVVGDSAFTWVVVGLNQRIEIRSLDGKAVRRIALTGESNQVPTWSPDGKSIAYQVTQNGRTMVAVVSSNGNGNAPRVFHDAFVGSDQGGTRWSPDSRSIAFVDPDRHEFRLLDVATGRVRTVARDSLAQIHNWTWRADGRSVAAVMLTRGASPGPGSVQRRVDEITLDGKRRTLLDAAALRGAPGVQFVDENTIFVRYDSAAYRVPLDGGAPKRVVALSGASPAASVASTAPGTDAWAAFGTNGKGASDLGQIEFISARTGERRVADVPFRVALQSTPVWTPDGRELLVPGRAARDTVNRLYAVPVNGGAPRAVAPMGQGRDGWTSVSPDGKFVAYTMEDGQTTRLLLVDLRPAFRGASGARQ